ncbi:MAG: GlcG/HbpS family heme-binding protein [Gammaproteobacteria bacterium]
MSLLNLEHARTIVRAAREAGRAKDLDPLAVAVLDSGGHLKAFEREDGTSVLRFEIARGKAFGAIGLGIGSRAIFERAQEQAYFVSAVNALAGGSLVPVPGGVLIKSDAGKIVGAVGISGDNSDNDEACAIAGIEAAGFVADPG